MKMEELRPNVTVHGPLFPEPVQVIIALPMGTSVKLVGNLGGHPKPAMCGHLKTGHMKRRPGQGFYSFSVR